MKNNTFKSFIEEYYYDSIYERLNGYVSSHPSFIRDQIDDDVRVMHPELEDYSVEAVYIEDKGENDIDFDVVCRCDVNYEFIRYVKRRADHDSDCASNIWIVIHGSAKLNALKKAKLYGPEPYEKESKHKPLNGDMVPIINATEYSKYAVDIIKQYYGPDYDLNKPIKARDLAGKMGLTVKPLNPRFAFEKGKAIFGQIYFEETKTAFYDKNRDAQVEVTVPSNTILYDPACHSVYSYGSEEITIAHECVHYALHKKAFLFAKFITNGHISCISCVNGGTVSGIEETNENESFMESQANGIAPYLVMPEETFKNRAKYLYKTYREKSEPIEFMDRMINDLRFEFSVTIPAIKKRLKELGFLDGISVFEWDKEKERYIDAHSYKKGSLKYDESYSITEEEFIKACNQNNDNNLLGMVFLQNFIYVDNHVIYDDERYVIRDDDGDAVITEYAKRHMDECALKFKVKSGKSYISSKNVTTFCYLCKGIEDDMKYEITLSNDFDNMITRGDLAELKKRNQDAEKTVIRLIEDSEDLSSCVKKLIDLYEINTKHFEVNGITAASMSRYLSGESKQMDIRKAICFTHTLWFSPKVSEVFLKKYCKDKIGSDPEGQALTDCLVPLRGKSIKQLNVYLTKHGFKPLSGKESQ